MALSIQFTRLTPIYPNGVYVQWTLAGVDPALSGPYLFQVFRAGAPSGPWEQASEPLPNQFSTLDSLPQPAGTLYKDVRRPNVFSLVRSMYYRVTVQAPNGVTAETVSRVEPALDQFNVGTWRKADRDFRLGLKFSGTPCAIFKRRRWGTRCPKCYDKIVRDSLRSACTTCLGTGFTGGFWDPTVLKLRRSEPQPSTQNTPEQRQDGSLVRIEVPYTPAIEQGDLFVFLRDGKRFLADQAIETQITLKTVHQVVTSLELARDHILFRLKVDAGILQPLL